MEIGKTEANILFPTLFIKYENIRRKTIRSSFKFRHDERFKLNCQLQKPSISV